MSTRLPIALIVAGVVLFAAPLWSADPVRWPQFRGPTGQGLAVDARPPLRWSEKVNVAWRRELPGLGHSSPVIDGDEIWLSTASLDGKELGVVGVDRRTGAILRQKAVFSPANVEKIHEKNSYASTTPVLADGKVYVHFGTYGAACVETSSGRVVWKNEDLRIDHQGGPGSSPVLFRNLLIVTCDGADHQYVAGLDAATGEVRWKRSRSAKFRDNPITHRAFATPLLVEHDGRPALLSPAADQLHAYDPATGGELWHVRYTGFSTVPCPAFANGIVYFCTGYFSPELWAVRAGGQGDVTSTHVEWTVRTGVPEIPSPLVWDGRVYVVSDKGVASCYDAATGKRDWTLRLGGNHSASPLLADGHLYFCAEDGTTRVVPIPSERGQRPKILASNHLKGAIMASPAALESALYVRTDEALYRIEAPAGDAP